MDSGDHSHFDDGGAAGLSAGGHPRVVVSGGRVRRFRPLVVLGAVILGLAATAGVGALAYLAPPEVGLPVAGVALAGFALWNARRGARHVPARTRRALTAFARRHRLGRRFGHTEVLADGRVYGVDVVVGGDALRFPLRGFDVFDRPPRSSRVAYDHWKALALLGGRELTDLDARLAELAAPSALEGVAILDGSLDVRFSRAATLIDVERAAERAAKLATQLDRAGLAGKDPVALAGLAVVNGGMPADERRALFDGLATFHRSDDVTRDAARRLVDDPDGRLARAAAELLGDDAAAARVDARAGALALAPTRDGRLSVTGAGAPTEAAVDDVEVTSG